jgi:phosphatidylglycerol:prolipoprotein diacylglycerol transferase
VNVHAWFDIAAALAAAAMTVGCFFWRLRDAATRVERAGAGYALALVAGATVGGYAAGTANLWLSGEPGVARSIVGALTGAIIAIEIYKRARGITGSTGIIFVPAFCTSVAVGRWGCFHSGLTDHTHGSPASIPWAHDFGDGVLRHPVQLYESAAMAAFLVYALVMLARRSSFFLKNGFYLMVLWYVGQRFCWEFLKPYAPVLGPLNLFHLICLGLMAYAIWMLRHPYQVSHEPLIGRNMIEESPLNGLSFSVGGETPHSG